VPFRPVSVTSVIPIPRTPVSLKHALKIKSPKSLRFDSTRLQHETPTAFVTDVRPRPVRRKLTHHLVLGSRWVEDWPTCENSPILSIRQGSDASQGRHNRWPAWGARHCPAPHVSFDGQKGRGTSSVAPTAKDLLEMSLANEQLPRAPPRIISFQHVLDYLTLQACRWGPGLWKSNT